MAAGCYRKSFGGPGWVGDRRIGLEIGYLFDSVAGKGQPVDGPGCEDGRGVTNEPVAGDADIGMHGG
jgi:hypothetical protein